MRQKRSLYSRGARNSSSTLLLRESMQFKRLIDQKRGAVRDSSEVDTLL